MDNLRKQRLTRRELQLLLLVTPAPLAAALLAGKMSGIAVAQDSDATPGSDTTPVLAPTPECGDTEDFEVTQAQTAGPFFTPDSQERTSMLEDGMPGAELLLTGYVYAPNCEPIPGALIDFWQCDDAGVYDNVGYTLRGHQFSADDGRYELTTIVPGLYPGRTRHIHVNVQAPNGPILTSQLYFPDEPANAADGIFDERLIMDVSEDDDRQIGFFTFVVEGNS